MTQIWRRTAIGVGCTRRVLVSAAVACEPHPTKAAESVPFRYFPRSTGEGMIHFLMRKCPVGSDPAFMKAGHAQRVTSCGLALVAVLTLFFVGHGFGAEDGYDVWQVPPGQPAQMWSKVDYDPKLTDTFFESDEWSYPYWIIKHPDGHFTSTRSSDTNPVENPPHLKHTAKCFSTSFGVKHVVSFCEARLFDEHSIDLLIHETNPAFRDSLLVRIRDGKFQCQYWIIDGFHTYTWTTTSQELTLDKKAYAKGDFIKGRIDFECLAEPKDPKDIQRWGRDPTTTIKVFGVFKTILE
jgi:hypothetical protein